MSSSYSLVALIRHGAYHQKENTPSALQPFPLTEQGELEVRAQAQQFASQLTDKDWQLAPVVHSSPLLRAWQTAQIYIEELRDFFSETPEHAQFPELVERSVGSVANLSTDEIERLLDIDPRFKPAPKGWKSNSHYCLPFLGAESLLDAGQRVAEHIESHVKPLKSAQVNLIVGHGAAIRHAACHLNVMQLCDVNRLSMHHAHPVVLSKENSEWRHIAGEWKVREFGSEAKD